jgi:hypothetical protein
VKNIQQLKKQFYELQKIYLESRNDKTLTELYFCIEKYIIQVLRAKKNKSKKYDFYNSELLIENIMISILKKYKTDLNYKIDYLPSFINNCIYFQCCNQNKKKTTETINILDKKIVQISDNNHHHIESAIINNVDSDILINEIEIAIDRIMHHNELTDSQHNIIINSVITAIGRKREIKSMLYRVPDNLHELFKKVMREIYTILTKE